MADPLAPVLSALARPGRPTSDYDLNAGNDAAPGQTLRPAAVLLGFQERRGGTCLILTKRAPTLRHHPGQVAFPGGKIDDGDRSAAAAALREAREEIGLDRAEVLGEMEPHVTVTGFSVTPVLARIAPAFRPVAEPSEVEEVFTVPLSLLADPKCYRIEGRVWRGQMRRYYVIPYGPYYIWGATARMLRALADRMTE